MGRDDNAVAEQTVLGLLRQGRGTAAQTEHQHLMGTRHQFSSPYNIAGINAALGQTQRLAGFAEHHVPQRRAVFAGLGRGRRGR